MSAPRNVHHVHHNPNSFDTLHVNGYHLHRGASRTPNRPLTPLPSTHSAATTDADPGQEEDPKVSFFAALLRRNEARLEALYGCKDGEEVHESSTDAAELEEERQDDAPQTVTAPPKKSARTIDEDDYDDSEGEDDEDSADASPLKAKSTGPLPLTALSSAPMVRHISSTSMQAIAKQAPSAVSNKTSEDARKKLEQDKKETEDAAKRSFHTLFYSAENDRDAMSDQKKLEESERQVDVEMSGQGNSGTPSSNPATGNGQQGTLSQTNLGASSLTLKHLIARIDMKRDKVVASDLELRSLMSEVRKNRSKWASEDRVGQEELYESAEKVLNELKAMTEHSTAFLQRVNKRDAPDYHAGKNKPEVALCRTILIRARSDQTAHGSGNDDQKAQGRPIQMQGGLCHRSESHLVKLSQVQSELRALLTSSRPFHAQGDRKACTAYPGDHYP